MATLKMEWHRLSHGVNKMEIFLLKLYFIDRRYMKFKASDKVNNYFQYLREFSILFTLI